MRRVFAVISVLFFATQQVPGQGWPVAAAPPTSNLPGAAKAVTFDGVIDQALLRESELWQTLRNLHPVVETYIQDMTSDADFGSAPKGDHYFLGKLDLSKGVSEKSFIPKPGSTPASLGFLTHFFSVAYMPRGFAQMVMIDGTNFDRDHYDFEFQRREFLGEVRTYVVAVQPKKGMSKGAFSGSLWIEDKDFNIVRFNGTYGGSSGGHMYAHFDSWRVNAGPGLWLPSQVYSEEQGLSDAAKIHTLRFKALTRLWGYAKEGERGRSEFTNLTVENARVEDSSAEAADNSPLESRRAWARQAEDNVLDRLERAGILARPGGIDRILDTVVNNLMVTNKLNIVPEVRTRAVLTTPLESFTVGHTIVISRGLLDTLPDEASLAAILAHELAHIALGHETDTTFAFSDRVLFDDEKTLKRFRMVRTQEEEDAANAEAVRLLMQSPYKDRLDRAGLFLKALGNESGRLPMLITPLFGSRMAANGKGVGDGNVLRLAELLANAPQLQGTRTDQIAALPLGSRTKLDPWNDDLEMVRTRVAAPISAREKMPFELAPVYLRLVRQGVVAEKDGAGNQGVH